MGAPHSLHCAEDETHKRAEPPPRAHCWGQGLLGQTAASSLPFLLWDIISHGGCYGSEVSSISGILSFQGTESFVVLPDGC